MSDGKCGAHHYANITKEKIEKMLAVLREQGFKVTGNNPWTINTNNNGVVLKGTWNESTSTLTVIVTEKNFYVPCSKIWDAIDPLINGLSTMELEENLMASNDGKCGAHHYANITQEKMDKMLDALRRQGYKVTGNNPWTINTNNNGVVLRGSWDQAASRLTVIVTEKNFYVPCSKIWDAIDPLINGLSSMSVEDMV